MVSGVGIVIVIAAIVLLSGLKVLNEYERAVVFRLGRLNPFRGPGIIFVIPILERAVRIDLRTVTLDIPAQDVITRDNVTVKVSAVLYFRVIDPSRAVTEVRDYLYGTMQLAQTTLRSVGGQTELDDLLSQREKLNAKIQEVIDAQTEPWGIKVVLVELKNIDLPQDMQRAIAAQAEAERERRAKVIAWRTPPRSWARAPSRCNCAICRRSPRSRPSTIRPSCSRCQSICSNRSCACARWPPQRRRHQIRALQAHTDAVETSRYRDAATFEFLVNSTFFKGR
jgi:SPFH domain / Band 7 family